MAKRTEIAWTDMTFNPWIGCTKVSAGCARCYAEHMMDKWLGRVKWGPGQPRKRTSEKYWKDPITWNKKAKAAGKRALVFCASLADVFDPEVPNQWRMDLYELIAKTPWLMWQLLTKRPEHAAMMARPHTDNWWLGITVEDQAAADLRVPILLDIPAPIRFLSCEPMLGPIEFPLLCNGSVFWSGIHWIICGGESGQGARSMCPDWARGLREQCKAADVAFFFKQWGAWLPSGQSGQQTDADYLPAFPESR